MEDKVEKALDDFVEVPQTEEEIANAKIAKAKNDNVKKVVLDEREGLIERLDHIYVTKDGKQLLREQY
jgi:hypothetical protein